MICMTGLSNEYTGLSLKHLYVYCIPSKPCSGSDVTYLAIYDVLGISASLFLFIATILRSVGTANASKRLHKEITEKVLYYPMSFFDTVRIQLLSCILVIYYVILV